MMRKLFGLLVVCVALLGILDASYLTYSEYGGIIPPCKPPFDCGKVLSSSLSHIGPIPLSAFGIVYYALVLCLGAVAFLNDDHEDLLITLTSMGLLFSLYLVFTMGVILDAWCLYCLVSAVCCVIIFISSLIVFRSSPKLPGSTWFSRCFHSLYILIVKPIFFLFDAEFVHNTLTDVGSLLARYPLTRGITRLAFAPKKKMKPIKLDGLTFPTRVGLSAGFDYTGSLTGIVSSLGFGFSTIGTITARAYEGNTKPRLGRFPRSKALLVNKGFKNAGAKAVIKKLSPLRFEIPVGVSIGSTNTHFEDLDDQIDDVIAAFTLFEHSDVRHSYYELNISCPNVKQAFSFTGPKELKALLDRVEKLRIKRPIYLKMPIDYSEAETLALLTVAANYSIAGVIFGNLTKDKSNPAVDPADQKAWEKVKGNLSGLPTQSRSNTFIALTKKHFKKRFTIIGTGGIFTPADAAEKIRLGADLVQMITGMIYEGPGRVGEIATHLSTIK